MIQVLGAQSGPAVFSCARVGEEKKKSLHPKASIHHKLAELIACVLSSSHRTPRAMNTSSNRDVITEDLRTTQYAQDAAFYLQTISADPTLSRVQTLRYRELQQSLPLEHRNASSPPTCSLCGTLMIPGWTGTMQLSTINAGRRKRKLEDSEKLEKLRHGNRLEWNCETCGSKTLCAQSNPNTKSKFGPVKRHKPLAELLKPRATVPMKVEAVPSTEPSIPTMQVDPKPKDQKGSATPQQSKLPDKPAVKPVPSWKQPSNPVST